MKVRFLTLLALGPVTSAAAQSRLPLISGDTAGAKCSATAAAADINAWFVALSVGDTASIRRLAQPALLVFSAGRNGLPEPFFRADSVPPLVRYVAERHRVRDHWNLLEVQFRVLDRFLGFTPITRRTSRDPRATQGLWLGKAEYECGRGIRVMNLAPWPSNIPPYRPHLDRLPNER